MNSKQRKTMEAVLRDPVSRTLVWTDVESMLVSLGCTLTEGAGSRVRFTYGTHVYATHRPHPGKEAKPYMIRDVRAFLTLTGLSPQPTGKKP